MEYLEWNNLIAKHFFNEEKAGKEVLLYVDDDIITEIGKNANCDVADFIKSVKQGPPWAFGSSLCQMALHTYEHWRNRGLGYPPYISYLACFVLAAGLHGDFAPHAYYPRLRTLLGENENAGPLPSFDRMIELWDDLERWSSEDRHEEMGRFVARIRGGYWKVGLPLSQTVISEDEKRRLPLLFTNADLDPSSPPSPQTMSKLMTYYGDRIFAKRTLKLINATEGEHKALKDNLVEMILEELEQWDGTVPAATSSGKETSDADARDTKCNMRICLKYDPLSKEAKTTLRIKSNRQYPEDGLAFEYWRFQGEALSCEESHQGWSTLIKKESVPLDASTLDWHSGILFIDRENGWKASLKGEQVRIYISCGEIKFQES